jgi:CheY-like chemotaxis protein
MTKPRIFVLDDEPDVLEILTTIIQSTGEYDANGSTMPDKALEILFSDKNYDVLLLDIAMPEIDGWEVLDYLKSNYETRDIKVILITARTSDRSKVLAIQKGASDFISKPFHKEQVLLSIKNALNE